MVWLHRISHARAARTAHRLITARLVWALTALSLATSLSGCSTAQGVYGDHARYSPAFEGYVISPENGSDDPSEDDPVLVLRDPLTGHKLHCRNEALTWRELHEDLAADFVHDDNVALAVGITGGAFFGPLVVLDPIGGLVLAEAMITSDALYEGFRSENATELLANGVALYRRKRFFQAIKAIERALAKDAAVGIFDKGYLYLGLAHDAHGDDDRARLALTMFIDRALVRDVAAYRLATATLKKLGVERDPCSSTAPVELYW